METQGISETMAYVKYVGSGGIGKAQFSMFPQVVHANMSSITKTMESHNQKIQSVRKKPQYKATDILFFTPSSHP